MKQKRFLCILLITIIAFTSFTGCSKIKEAVKESIIESDDIKTYSESGFSIKLPDTFTKKSYVSLTLYLESPYAIVTALTESFSSLSTLGITEDSTLDDYSKIILQANNMTNKSVTASENGKYVYFEYYNNAQGKDFYYLAALYKGTSCFWMSNFCCEKGDESKYKDKFLKWADTVVVD